MQDRHSIEDNMIGRNRLGAWRFHRLCKILTWIGCLVCVLFAGGCSTTQLANFRRHAAAEDFEWIATQTISCEKVSNVCGRLYLIRGDACFHLAKTGHGAKEYYDCAANAYYQGLSLMPAMTDEELHKRYLQNLCESLSYLQDTATDGKETNHTFRLMETAKDLYQLAPDSASGRYYLSKGRLLSMGPLIHAGHIADRSMTCVRLQRTLLGVLSMIETAKNQPPPDWDRFSNKFQRLAFDLGNVLREAGCR